MNTPRPTDTETCTLRRASKPLEVSKRLNGRKKYNRWGVAQPAERLAVNQEVGGSNPPAPVEEKVGIKRLSGLSAREAVLVRARSTCTRIIAAVMEVTALP